MRDQGAELVHGDLDDPGSLREAMRGAYGVFSVQALAYEHENLAREVHQGKALRSPGSPGALLHRGPLRTVRATRRGTRLKQAAKGGSGALC
ncbi:NmrA family NAD(P)-binding protein [Nonomuraea fuscirosea]|uniref:NmrA family NAD(P)-binding protein n=1 Tax=Nonomuraea fuscirosea TaxID=1291556 RepID=UPI002DD97109|nr:NmrA family NAD(P)-binding protein [Nonomuraea fuscirosea]WSA58352.1 NmrA family NAD(P)-binding protein [Nonomuraea fuscirosea]